MQEGVLIFEGVHFERGSTHLEEGVHFARGGTSGTIEGVHIWKRGYIYCIQWDYVMQALFGILQCYESPKLLWVSPQTFVMSGWATRT